MKRFIRIILLTLVIISFTSFSIDRINFNEGKSKNVCKELKDNVLLYMIFVDSKQTSPWTEFDIQTTLDSVSVAVEWLEKKARSNDISLNIFSDYHIGEEFTTIRKRLPEESVLKSINEPNFKKGMENLNDWADKIARQAGSSFPTVKKDGIPEIEQPRNKERLIAYLRDKHNVEYVALFYMLNNYFKEDISLPINTMNTKDVEFAIVSYKYPSEIVHNLLHLFGAADLDESPYRRNKRNIELADQFFPDAVMQDPYAKNINAQSISELTKYLIGWKDDLEKKYKNLLKDNIIINF